MVGERGRLKGREGEENGAENVSEKQVEDEGWVAPGWSRWVTRRLYCEIWGEGEEEEKEEEENRRSRAGGKRGAG